MAMCPLLRKECIKGECAWWYEAGYEYESEDQFLDEYDEEFQSGEYSECMIALLRNLFYDIESALGDVKSALDDVKSGLEDVRSEVQRVEGTITAFGGV